MSGATVVSGKEAIRLTTGRRANLYHVNADPTQTVDDRLTGRTSAGASQYEDT